MSFIAPSIHQSIHQLRQQLSQFFSVPSPSKEYQQWREQFIRDRIKLNIVTSLLFLTILATLNLGLILPVQGGCCK